ncbi:CPBP family intramembrane metalloprotease [Methanoculleus sp. CWC-02]|uniref:CPBP family intramembrane metalloprotease n=2 Tax=Methanoculleus oceani TaxID=2184756 RepID=A0ABD4T9M8_9EURY|nr:CPBP family intramembrane metalloprotease [Methanoculleus sp. CWC-02]
MVFNPFIAASILTCRKAGSDGVRLLWKRSFDYKRIRRKIWYIPLLLLIPAATTLQYGLMRLMGVSIPGLQFPLLMMPVYFPVFFILAIGEEVGWSGYALDPLQDRWGALPAGIILGTVWALWHLVPYSLANPPLWVAGQCVATVMARILMVWLYNNTGKSVFGMILFHAMINMGSVPDYGFPYDPVLVSVILTVMAAVVVFLWGPGTLARYRYG